MKMMMILLLLLLLLKVLQKGECDRAWWDQIATSRAYSACVVIAKLIFSPSAYHRTTSADVCAPFLFFVRGVESGVTVCVLTPVSDISG